MAAESFEDQLSRLEQMAEDELGDTWDLSPNDRAAIKAVVRRVKAPHSDPLTRFTWLEEARFVPDDEGGHIEFADKVFRVVK